MRPGRTSPSRSPASTASTISASDRKSTRLNSSHSQISYAVFCLKKKKQNNAKSIDDSEVNVHTDHRPPHDLCRLGLRNLHFFTDPRLRHVRLLAELATPVAVMA